MNGRLLAARNRLAPILPAVVILVAAMVWGTQKSPYFLDADSLLTNTARYVEIGLLALGLTIVIINGDIDVSVASNIGVCAATIGLAYDNGAPIPIACALAVVVGVALGAFNGLLVTVLGLPSLVVTLGTLALYRGIAQVMLRDRVINDYPDGFVGADQVGLLHTTPDLRLPLAVLLVFAVGFWFLLQRTSYGLSCFLTGSSEAATRFSGVNTRRTRFVAFCLAGFVASVAAILITSRLGATRSNVALGMELPAITVVVLGGTSIAGGRGSIQGSVLALFAAMAVREALTITNTNGQTQDAVMGLILIGAILVPRTVTRVGLRLRRARARSPQLKQSVGLAASGKGTTWDIAE